MAPGTAWPTTRNGKELTFLVQVALPEAEGFIPATSPLRGHLAFFVDLESSFGHASDFDRFCVLHVTGEKLDRASSPVPELPSIAVRVEHALTVPTAGVVADLGIQVDGDYEAVREALGVGGHRLLGNGDFIHHMPLRSFKEAVKVHPDRPGRNPFTGESIVIRGRTLEGVPATVIELLRKPAKWRPLLQLDTDPALDMQWGDMGRLWFLVREDDWKKQRFDRVWVRSDYY